MPKFVLDTDVLVRSLRSARGASGRLLSMLPLVDWQLVLSVPLYLQYQDVLSRPDLLPPIYGSEDIGAVCRQLAAISEHRKIYFLWRPVLVDPGDDLVLELAVAAGARYIVTCNLRHFKGAERFGITVLAPNHFLKLIERQDERRDNSPA